MSPRFRPPAISLPDELIWLLEVAFGSTTPDASGLDLARLLDFGARFDLLPRVAARADFPRVLTGLGPLAVAFLLRGQARCERRGRALMDLAAELSGSGLPFALLKFGALRRAGVLASGSRDAGDLDILAPEEAFASLDAALRSRGFLPFLDGPTADHQLAPLRDSAGRIIEVHRCLPGVVAVGRGRFATWEDLESSGLLEPRDESGLRAPRRTVLVAHAVAHGMAQHGLAPRSYPMLRMVADVLDLGRGELFAARPLLVRSVLAEEINALSELADRLAAGDARNVASSSEPAGVLLRHMVAGVLDDDYARSLKLRYLLWPLAETSRPRAVARGVAELFQGGRPANGLGRTWAVARRAFELGMNGVRHLAFEARFRLRRQGRSA